MADVGRFHSGPADYAGRLADLLLLDLAARAGRWVGLWPRITWCHAVKMVFEIRERDGKGHKELARVGRPTRAGHACAIGHAWHVRPCRSSAALAQPGPERPVMHTSGQDRNGFRRRT